MKISTRMGDNGKSRLFSGKLLKKSELIFETLGNLDELNSVFGLCKAEALKMARDKGAELLKVLEILQTDVYRIMGIIGNEMAIPKNIREIDRKDVLLLEQYIEKFEEEMGEIKNFSMPGKNEISARLHHARSVCRRAERSLVKYTEERTVPEFILQYMNRMSDLLFLMAEKFSS